MVGWGPVQRRQEDRAEQASGRGVPTEPESILRFPFPLTRSPPHLCSHRRTPRRWRVLHTHVYEHNDEAFTLGLFLTCFNFAAWIAHSCVVFVVVV